MIDEDEFNRTERQHADFRMRLVQAWKDTQETIFAEYKKKTGSEKEKYNLAGFLSQSRIKHRETLLFKAKVSKTVYHDFLNGKPVVGYNSICRLLQVFEPVVSADTIWKKAFGVSRTSLHPTVTEAFEDHPARAMADNHLEGDPWIQGAVIGLRTLGDFAPIGTPRSVGIPPEEIWLETHDVPFRFNRSDPSLFDVDKWDELKRLESENRKANGEKYALVQLEPPDLLDEGRRINLTVRTTDHFTIMSCLSVLGNVEDDFGRVVKNRSKERTRHASLSPVANRVPNSLCLHYMLRFSDGNFLAIHRHSGMAYEKLKVSVSGEEQLAKADFDVPPDERVDHWIRRAYLEEVVPGRDLSHERGDGKELLTHLEWARCLSLIYEERFCGFAVVCLIQLGIDRSEYVEIYRKSLMMANRPDWEGNRYWFDSERLNGFFETGRLELTPFKVAHPHIKANAAGDIDLESGDYALHASSLHRLFLAGKITGVL